MRKVILTVVLALAASSAFAMCAHNESDRVMYVVFGYDVILSKSWTIDPGHKRCFEGKDGDIAYSYAVGSVAGKYYGAQVHVSKHGGVHVTKQEDGGYLLCSHYQNGDEIGCEKFSDKNDQMQ